MRRNTMRTKICYLITCHHEHREDIDDDEVLEEHAHDHHHEEEHHHSHHDATERTYNVNVNMKSGEYLQYVAKYGHHFSKELSEYAVSKISAPFPKIKYDKVEEILAQSDEALVDGNTMGDLYFEANRMKARHSSNTIKSDVHVVTLAIERINDTTDEEVFCEWCSNMKKRGEKIPWHDFI